MRNRYFHYILFLKKKMNNTNSLDILYVSLPCIICWLLYIVYVRYIKIVEELCGLCTEQHKNPIWMNVFNNLLVACCCCRYIYIHTEIIINIMRETIWIFNLPLIRHSSYILYYTFVLFIYSYTFYVVANPLFNYWFF